jgi:hypothetical protein
MHGKQYEEILRTEGKRVGEYVSLVTLSSVSIKFDRESRLFPSARRMHE